MTKQMTIIEIPNKRFEECGTNSMNANKVGAVLKLLISKNAFVCMLDGLKVLSFDGF